MLLVCLLRDVYIYDTPNLLLLRRLEGRRRMACDRKHEARESISKGEEDVVVIVMFRYPVNLSAAWPMQTPVHNGSCTRAEKQKVIQKSVLGARPSLPVAELTSCVVSLAMR